MPFFDLLRLAFRNLREAKLRATLTSMGVIVGVAVIVTMVSFGLGLQRNMLSRFRALDLFNEMQVFGKNVFAMAAAGGNQNSARRVENPNGGRAFKPDKEPTRVLDDAAIAEIAKIPGVAYVEPNLSIFTYVRVNGHSQIEAIGGASVPNASARFKDFKAGQMISSADADEAVVKDTFARDFGFDKPEDAIGKTIEFLAAPKEPEKTPTPTQKTAEEEPPGFFGIPLEPDSSADNSKGELVAKTFRIVGVVNTEIKEGAGQGGRRGLLPDSRIYIPLKDAREWTKEHRSPMGMVALALARQSGSISQSDSEGYDSAVVRVTDPVIMTEVRKQLTEKGFGSFSIVDQLDQIRTVFLIIDSVLGLLGGISLLVASFGIANTMIMSILERTREIGIMKAIGAEDREIKLIFFFEAAVIGLTGGVMGSLAAWGIDAVANRLAYRFILKPQGGSFVDFFFLPPYLWLGAIVFALSVSILAALYPAARAARIDPVRALRHD
jgi:ABC-type antimicrobial peptide transport system permease subunit